MIVSVLNIIPNETPDWCDLFNHPDFYNLHKTKSSVYLSFYLDSKLIGLIHFTETENLTYRSPYRGTYGNISFKEGLDLQVKYECVEKLEAHMKALGAKNIEILSEPFSHHLHNSASLFNVYLSRGFEIHRQEINHTLSVDQHLLIEKMMRNNKKRLNKCERENFIFEQVFSDDEIKKVYLTIKENRESKGYKVSMDLGQIMEMYSVFPNDIYFFKASQNRENCAASICMRLNKNVLYVFYWGDKPGFEQYSPVAFLANGIYAFAQQRNFVLIDAGTSSINGLPNFGVATFKENLGFTISPKITYVKQL